MEIQREWRDALLANRSDLTTEQLDSTIAQMNLAVPDCLVTGHQSLVPGLSLPDDNDRHVLAAAICCGAAEIVTMNLQDFPDGDLAEFDIAAVHPDDFLMNLDGLEDIDLLAKAASQARRKLRRPPLTPEKYIDSIRRNQLPQVADHLASRIELI